MRPFIIVAAALTAACSAEPTAPAPGSAQPSTVKFWEAGSSVGWNQTARDLIATHTVASPVQAAALTPRS